MLCLTMLCLTYENDLHAFCDIHESSACFALLEPKYVHSLQAMKESFAHLHCT